MEQLLDLLKQECKKVDEMCKYTEESGFASSDEDLAFQRGVVAGIELAIESLTKVGGYL